MKTDSDVALALSRAVNILAKWRSVFAGWQLGTRAKGDPECDAVRDHREVTILMRAELNTLTRLLIDAGVFSARQFSEALTVEAGLLAADYSKKFPGMKADETGIAYSLPQAAETMKGWKP